MKLRATLSVLGIAGIAMPPLGAIAGENDQPTTGASPTVNGSTAKPYDWSSYDRSSWAAGSQLPAEWQPSDGSDFSLAPVQPAGSAWAGIAAPNIRPAGKAPFEARFEGAKDDSRVGATLSRSVPLGRDFSVTWQNTYALTQPVTPAAPSSPYVSQYGFISPSGVIGQSTENREIDQSLRFKVAPYGTTFSAGTATSATDQQWHNRLSIEQNLPGSFNVTTSIDDAGTTESRKSITAGFKKVW
ncbi:MAG: hypothetical protein K2Y27_20980 [Xanthobacteraceae bacterium]|nr:hypothetical protein [Xanthobacteraceae bacterium]